MIPLSLAVSRTSPRPSPASGEGGKVKERELENPRHLKSI